MRYHGDVWAWHDSGVSSGPEANALYALMPQVWLTYFSRYGTPWQRRLVRPVLLAICSIGWITELAGGSPAGKHFPALKQALTYRPDEAPTW